MIKNIIISIIVIGTAAVSVYSIVNESPISPDSYQVLANAAIGVFGVLLLAIGLGIFRLFFFLWIILQAAIVQLPESVSLDLSFVNQEAYTFQQLNFIQGYSFIPEQTILELNDITLQVNVISLVLLILFLIPVSSKSPSRSRSRSRYSGKPARGMPARISKARPGEIYYLKLFRMNSIMGAIMPQKVQVIQRMDFPESKNWLLVRLSKPVKFGDGNIVYNALIKPKEEGKFMRNVRGQLGYFRLLTNRKHLRSNRFNLRHTLFIDWVLVR